ncbi:hypothetical protein [Mangrovimonas sp. DI 80]|uniref:hypothetical protein n=1 Tax=Mangrovimonas sp. DI 80 TaxID=1779330 RepID=UPI00097711A3|nr:hypothetical protein [Mangrovimonas sp. DI 80]OMP31163.1 hypothetical protein BKM32_08870 [Mangrovimonas sp. DI 80]
MKYFVLSTQRSGSDLLRHTLIDIFDEASDGPDEWIVHPLTRQNLKLPESYEKALELVIDNPEKLIDEMSPNSHRKVMYSHLGKYLNLPKSIPVVHLIRKDSWSQAKSYWIMKQNIVPAHISQENFSKMEKVDISLKIDYEEIEKLAKTFFKQKQNWFYGLKNRPNTLLLYYEEDLANTNELIKTTIPKIEFFLNKKRKLEEYDIPLKKTSTLYTIENRDLKREKRLIEKYYFRPTFKYWFKNKVKSVLGM